MKLDKRKLVQGAAVIGFGAVLNILPVPNRLAAVAGIGIEIAITVVESIKKERAECGVKPSSERNIR